MGLRFFPNRVEGNLGLQPGVSGFTLLEVIIAMTIMVLSFASILAVEQGSIRATARAKQMNVVGMLAKNQMVETEFKIQNKTFDEVKKEESGTFAAPYEDYHWKTIIKELKFPNLAALGGGGKKGGGATSGNSGDSGDSSVNSITEMVTKLMTQYFSKAIREVSVTVSWKQGPGEQSFTLSTYWVNLNAQFQLQEQ
jgi:prepilin-type N-terminal cleavage/methylation domain-containing protein